MARRHRLGRLSPTARGHFGGVTSLDENVGRLLAVLDEEGLAENTVVLIMADHGEMLGTHGRWMKDIWYEPSIGVPSCRWLGHAPAGTTSDCLLNTPDVLPTLCGLMGWLCLRLRWRGPVGAMPGQ